MAKKQTTFIGPGGEVHHIRKGWKKLKVERVSRVAVALVSPQQKPTFVPRPKGGTQPGPRPTSRRS
jgi:hypothetical protein